KGTSDIALRLVFRLRESVQPGDRLDVTVLDAVFATTGNAVLGNSLATANQTLRAFHAHISVT
ncbi:MAG: hypothetical protein LBS56_00870, partial [Propionibacteriaceae bacterium]|nr:hypothetical protein [Propionibacteriaceae bacterium]